jgi:hypothetical protein
MKTIRGVTLFVFSLCCVTVNAETLPDPTRPPIEVGEVGGVSHANNTNSRSTPKGLLSVIMSPDRCAAIIDGKTYQLGDKYGAATLVEITRQGIVLYSTRGMRNMGLFPGVGVKIVAPSTTAQSVVCKIENYKTEKKLAPRSGLKEKK